MRRLLLLVGPALVFVPRAALTQGAPLGPGFRVNAYTTGDQARSSVAEDSFGNFVVVWARSPTTGSSASATARSSPRG